MHPNSTIWMVTKQTEQNVQTLNDLKSFVQDLVEVVLTPISSLDSSDIPDGLKTDIERLNG